jgi:glucose-6-phosphate dehydrogenase assembly protein OpcA
VSQGMAAVLDRVEGELRAMWSAPAPGEVPRARACTMNLVVVAPTPALAAEWLPVIDDVLLATPARAIVVGLDPSGTGGLEAATSAVCTPGEGGGSLVCSERVTLSAHGTACEHLASCVAALCATDVPTTLVWLGALRAVDLAFEPLARDAARIVLDSTTGELASLARVVYWASARPAADRPGVADLTWTRLAPWQEMCARVFDEARLRPLASRIGRVTLVQASDVGAPAGPEAILLLAWLATRLGWKPAARARGGRELGLQRPDGGRVDVKLSADAASKAPRNALLAVRVEASADELTVRGEIARATGDPEAATWRLEVTGPGGPQRIEQHVRIRAPGAAGLLERTLHRPSQDSALADSAAWADGLREEELACG